jgi:hypothetical protein
MLLEHTPHPAFHELHPPYTYVYDPDVAACIVLNFESQH